MIRARKERSDADTSVVPSKKFIINLEQPCASMCISGTLLAVVGRKVFKILKIAPDQMQVSLDLRDLPGKQLNLNFSNNDVQWNPKEESQLATAPTNGCVILWDINKRTKSKIAHVFEGNHQRAVNKLNYHPRETTILISGSQDYTMNAFDTRQKTVVASYKGPESVRDVKFSQLQANDNYFAACYDNGVLHIWDRRHGDHPVKQVPMHSGPVYCCDWHLENDNWILSAGRDKMIKVIDIQYGRPKEVFSVATCSSVARARWRPNHKHHIASCSQFLDNSVLVWEVRRPFIPFASFAEHSDDVTDFQWLNDKVLVSCSKDGKIIQQLFSDAQRPVERATPVGLSFRPDGCLSHACSDSIVHRTKAVNMPQYGSSRHSYQPMSFKKLDGDPYQQSFLLFSSSLTEHCKKDTGDAEFFVQCAKSYKLHGLPIHELCDHNYQVAHQLGRQDIARTWLMLKLLFCSSDPDCSRLGLIQTKSPSHHSGSRQSLSQNTGGDNGIDSHTKDTTMDVKGLGVIDGSAAGDTGQDENEDDMEESNPHDVEAVLDFFESDDQDSDLPQNALQLGPQQKWELPAEPIQLRHDVSVRPPTPDHEQSSVHSTSHSAQESSMSLKQTTLDRTSYFKTDCFVKPQWNYSPIVLNMLQFYAEQGDVQTSVSALLVLGDKASRLIDDQITEQWFASYIDLLIHYEQWIVAALVIKLCPLQQINQRSYDSTCYQTGCGNCNKVVEKTSWVCQRCDKVSSICSVCNCTVRGLYVWCQGCGHGGHLEHLQSWYSRNSLCPAGCGHEC